MTFGSRNGRRWHGIVASRKWVSLDLVRIYHQVTTGSADAYVTWAQSDMDHIEIGDDAVLFPGAKVLGGAGAIRVGVGTIIAANAVVMSLTGDWEIWGGIPARKLGDRTREEERAAFQRKHPGRLCRALGSNGRVAASKR
jgi:serine acetyltransferase